MKILAKKIEDLHLAVIAATSIDHVCVFVIVACFSLPPHTINDHSYNLILK